MTFRALIPVYENRFSAIRESRMKKRQSLHQNVVLTLISEGEVSCVMYAATKMVRIRAIWLFFFFFFSGFLSWLACLYFWHEKEIIILSQECQDLIHFCWHFRDDFCVISIVFYPAAYWPCVVEGSLREGHGYVFEDIQLTWNITLQFCKLTNTMIPIRALRLVCSIRASVSDRDHLEEFLACCVHVGIILSLVLHV